MADLSSLARRPLLRLAAAATAASVMFGAWVGAMFFAAPRPPEVRTFAAAESPSLAESLRVLSYNVWGVPNIVNDDAGRLPTLLTHLDSYDIVGVQEMFTREAVEQISKAHFRTGFWRVARAAPSTSFRVAWRS